MPVFYLTGQVVAAYRQVRLTPSVVGSYRQDFGGPRRRDFAKLNLHLALFEQPVKDDFFSSLLRHNHGTPEISSGEVGERGSVPSILLPSSFQPLQTAIFFEFHPGSFVCHRAQ
jgi:hypothetical protein